MDTNTNFPRSILITDDHGIIRLTLREWLVGEFPELSIQEACSGEQALELLAAKPRPELVLMDFHLPGRSGIDVTKQIKNQFPDIRVVVLTIQEDQQYIEQAREAGADGYVIKRQMYTDLIPSIQNIFSGSIEPGSLNG
jgi:DNA-binding NarL/FixJ family response regulator